MCVYICRTYIVRKIFVFMRPNSCHICVYNTNSKINGTLKGVYLPISKLHSILAIANLLAHNNLWLRYITAKI